MLAYYSLECPVKWRSAIAPSQAVHGIVRNEDQLASSWSRVEGDKWATMLGYTQNMMATSLFSAFWLVKEHVSYEYRIAVCLFACLSQAILHRRNPHNYWPTRPNLPCHWSCRDSEVWEWEEKRLEMCRWKQCTYSLLKVPRVACMLLLMIFPPAFLA